MNIIIMRDGIARPITVSIERVIAMVSMLLAAPVVLGSLLFWLHAWHVRRGDHAGQGATMQRQAAEVQELQRSSRDTMAQLARQVGGLTAQASQLDAMGDRLRQLAGLPAAPLSLHAVAPVVDGLGAPAGPLNTNIHVAALRALVTELRDQLGERQVELAALTQVLAARAVRRMTTPGGWPVRGGWISSPFGPRPDPFTGRPGFHPGVDIAAPVGTPVRAMAAGIVIFAQTDGGFGRLVKVSDGHGEVTMYAHLSKAYVHTGEIVHKGTLIGRVGDTGYSTGPHLHFEVTMRGVPINPIGFLHLADRH
ncbi:MAG: peptidoglycan DD-metalloendopeptidase family protein [Gammaproteobacteria bacterium]|nr:peptidoglycan DD-metalloendopeptidase family protein [Gammaproteobacteria bacterium]